MKFFICWIILFSASFSLRAELITFDDIPGASGSNVVVPDGYKGFNWQAYDRYGEELGEPIVYYPLHVRDNVQYTVSAPYSYDGYGLTMERSNGGLFTVHDISLGHPNCSWPAAPGEICNLSPAYPVIAEGYVGGVLVGSQQIYVGGSVAPITFNLSLGAIDFFRIYGDSADFIPMDNINATAVPVPAAAWLFGSALIGLGARKFRTRTAVR